MKYILGTVIAILCSFTCTDTLYGKSPATDVDDILIINGDLYISFDITNNTQFQLKGDDLYCDVDISLYQLLS